MKFDRRNRRVFPDPDKYITREPKDAARKCYCCGGKGSVKLLTLKHRYICSVCHGTGELSGPLTEHEKQLVEDAEEAAEEAKMELRRERAEEEKHEKE